MRSRNGNNPFTRAIYATLIFVFTSLEADQYLISYRFASKNAVLFNESFHVSRAMTPCSTKIDKSAKTIILPFVDNQNLKHILLDNFEVFFEYIQTLGLHINHKDNTLDYQSDSFTIITLKTTCFKVDFNDSFVTMQALK